MMLHKMLGRKMALAKYPQELQCLREYTGGGVEGVYRGATRKVNFSRREPLLRTQTLTSTEDDLNSISYGGGFHKQVE